MKEVYSKMKDKLDKEMHELIVPEASDEDIENQKKMNQELEKTKELRDKLQTEADADDIKRAQDLNKELETTKKYADDLTKASAASPIAEKIAQKVRERLNKENMKEIKEAKLDFMGTADEETMKYLQEISREELVALEKQFVEMFDTLGVIRYNASEQLGKGASEISQRIHNFITIFRQVLKGYPVVKEDNTESLTNNHSNPVTEEFSAGRLKRVQDDLMKLIHKIADKEEIGKKEAIKRAIMALQDAHKGNIYEIISKLR